MKRTTSPKRAPPKKQPKKGRATPKAEAQKAPERCAQCESALGNADRALYVEEEVGRTFCSEDCIAAFFAPDIQRLEKDYFKHLPADDLSEDDREKHSHLRWQTIQEPQEIWREKTLAGDSRYTLISEYKVKNKTLWSVCICLLLRGEPSFLYLAFVSRKPEFVDRYRRGERVQRVKATRSQASAEDQATSLPAEEAPGEDSPKPMMDGLAEPWTEDELLIAERARLMKDGDIPSESYTEYEHCVEETLEKPSEVWGWESKGQENGPGPQKYYHFIRRYEDRSSFWYVIVAKETDQEDQLEIVDLFPTRDEELVSRYRRGEQEIGETEEQAVVSRLVH